MSTRVAPLGFGGFKTLSFGLVTTTLAYDECAQEALESGYLSSLNA